MKYSALLVGALLSSAILTPRANAAIYGKDSRQEAIVGETVTEQAFRATAVLLPRRSFNRTSQEGNYLSLDAYSIDKRHRLCEADTFGSQPAPGFCTAFLVAPDIMVTAGHCINSLSMCQNTAILFDFGVDKEGKAPTEFKDDQVYLCEEVIAHRSDASTGVDVAVIRLDRPTTNREPFSVHSIRTAEKGESVHALSYPYGGPAKVINDSVVRNAAVDQSFFVTNIDGFAGNSGSPVFSADHALLGFIVRGDQNLREKNSCFEQPHCSATKCRGEDVLSLGAFRDLVPHQGPHLQVDALRWKEKSGNMNGVPEPGESGTILMNITNLGPSDVKNTHFTLVPESENVRVQGKSPFVASIPANATKTVSGVNVELGSSLACESPLTFRLYMSNDSGSTSKALSFDLGTIKPIDFSIKPNETLPAYLPQGQIFTINVDEAPKGRKVLFNVDIDHSRPKQLILTATAPDGTTGYLYKLGLSSTHQSVGTDVPLVGTFGEHLTPFNDLSPFRHVKKSGVWMISIKDVGQGTSATIHELGVQILGRECSP